jgi:hypothetical protein
VLHNVSEPQLSSKFETYLSRNAHRESVAR